MDNLILDHSFTTVQQCWRHAHIGTAEAEITAPKAVSLKREYSPAYVICLELGRAQSKLLKVRQKPVEADGMPTADVGSELTQMMQE